MRRSTAEQCVRRWKEGGAFSFVYGKVTYVIDPAQDLFLLQHDYPVKMGRVEDVALDGPVLTIRTVAQGTLAFTTEDRR